jgi:hypothetical protein
VCPDEASGRGEESGTPSLRRKYATEFFASFTWEGIKVLGGAALVAVGGWILSVGRNGFPAFVQKHSIFIGVSLGVIGTFVLVRFYFWLKYRDAYPTQEYDFEQLTRAISFEYTGSGTVIYTKQIKLRARRQGLSKYVDKYRWTGESNPAIQSSVDGQSFLLTDRRNVWQFYEIRFERPLNKDESVQTKLVFTMIEQGHGFVPFISTTIEEPTRRLSLELKIPPSLGITYVMCEIAECMGSRNPPILTKQIPLKIDGVARWELTPKLHHYYEMKWRVPAEKKR